MISIIIPSFNNLDYLKLCIESIKKNSKFENEILVHVNEGNDGTIDYLTNSNIKFTNTDTNVGLCIGCKIVAKKSKFDLILYSHDDMYFLPDWDKYLIEKAKSLKTEKFYLSSIMLNGDPKLTGHLNLDAGDTFENFDEKYLLNNYQNLSYPDFEGSTWAPHLIHKNTWNKVGGFSEEFSPGAGSDPDLNMKLWKEGVRIFKGLNKCKVYHFGSIVTRKYKNHPTIKTESGNKGSKIFLLKWKISIRFFKKYYLRSDMKYISPLSEPNKNFFFYLNLLKCKLNYFYLKVFY